MTNLSPEPFIPAQPLSETLPTIIEQLPSDADHPSQTQFTRVRQRAFLQRLADSGEVRVAARASAVSHQTVYRLRRTCAAFRSGWDAALLIARERAEEELATRALHGVEEEVFYHGEVVAKRRRHDSRLLLAHLARLDRLADRADVAALAGAFDDVLDAFANAGEEGDVELPGVAPDTRETPAFAGAHKGEETPSGPCNMRSMSRAEEALAAAAEEEDYEWVDDDEEHLGMWKARLSRMKFARPDDARTPTELARDLAGEEDGGALDGAEIEAAQLEAFEAGEECWWEVMPGGTCISTFSDA